MVKLTTRFKIVGIEVVGFGVFVLALLDLEYNQSKTDPVVLNFVWIFIIIGITLILVGLEILYLTKKIT
jgi:hypothetical protein